MSFSIGQGDTAPDLVLTCSSNGSEGDDLTGATAVLRWTKPDGAVLDVELEEEDLEAGKWKVVWGETADTLLPGVHKGKVIVVLDGDEKTYPPEGTYFEWTVGAAI